MRTLLALLVAVPLTAQTIEVAIDTTDTIQRTAHRTILARQAVIRSADCEATAAELREAVAADTLDFSAIGGVDVIADTKDSQWVELELPLGSTSGMTKRFIRGALADAEGTYKGYSSGVGKVRLRKDRALAFLKSLDASLQ
jgi:hypothetical protein